MADEPEPPLEPHELHRRAQEAQEAARKTRQEAAARRAEAVTMQRSAHAARSKRSFLSREVAAYEAGVSVSTIDRWRKLGLAWSKIGRLVIIERRHLVEWIQRHGTDTTLALATLALIAVVLQLICALALMPEHVCRVLHELRHSYHHRH